MLAEALLELKLKYSYGTFGNTSRHQHYRVGLILVLAHLDKICEVTFSAMKMRQQKRRAFDTSSWA